MATVGIYKITNPNGRIYIGSSKNIELRFRYYKTMHCKGQRRLYNSLLKYGVDSHEFKVLIECKENELFEFENLFSCHYDVLGRNGLNCKMPNYKDIRGKVSEETKERIRIAATNISDVTREKMSYAAKNRPAISEETRNKFKEASKNRVIKDETRAKLSLINKGRQPSDKARELSRLRLLNNRPLNTKLVLNVESGVYFNGVREAAESVNMKRKTLSSMLLNINKNYTNFIYV